MYLKTVLALPCPILSSWVTSIFSNVALHYFIALGIGWRHMTSIVVKKNEQDNELTDKKRILCKK